jgi:hypothetical protein
MKILLYLFLALLICNCKQENIDMKVILFKDGTSHTYNLSSEEKEKVNKIISDIFLGIDEVLKLYFSEERIQELKNSEEVFEIFYDKPVLFATKEFDSLRVKKIIFPLTGDLIGNANSPEITIISGEEEYDSTPFRNMNGYENLMQLKKLIYSAKQDK